MKMVTKLCAFFLGIACPIASFICMCDSATFVTPVAIHPDHPGKCWHKESKTAVKPHQTIDLENECIQLTCLKNLTFGGSGCVPTMTLDNNCQEIDGDLSKPYPECCPKFHCIDKDGNENVF